MNRIWKWLVCASLFMTMIFCSGPIHAEPKAIDDWMPAEGLYVRKTASGIHNGRIDVIVIKDFYMNPTVLVGVESRSSSAVRIVRDATTLQSVSTPNLYPCGEGAGYAGGITSSALDGINAALKVIG